MMFGWKLVVKLSGCLDGMLDDWLVWMLDDLLDGMLDDWLYLANIFS